MRLLRQRQPEVQHGFKFYGKTLRLACFKPAHGANFEVLELFGKNRLADNDKIVTRYMDDKEFGSAAFAVLSKAICDSIPSSEPLGEA